MTSKTKKTTINVDDVFNNLTVIGESQRNDGGHEMFMCRCVCGVEKQVRKGNLGVVMGCGCVRKSPRSRKAKPSLPVNKGDVFHDWTVISQSDSKDCKGEAYFLCECKCGTKRDVRKSSLGRVQGCGCSRKTNGELTISRKQMTTPVKRPTKETTEEKTLRKKRVVDTLASLTDVGGVNLEPIYNVPQVVKSNQNKIRVQLENRLDDLKLQRELRGLNYEY